MIGYLAGTIKHIGTDFCIVLINGVGYEVFTPTRTLQQLLSDQPIELYVYTHVKEDQLKLFGFTSTAEKDLFTAVLGVSGVGPKTALSILSAGTVSQIQKAIIEADVLFLTSIKGLGKKTAQKIIIELKSKLGSIQELDLSDSESNYSSDVVLALQSFGFLKRDIIKTLQVLDNSLPEPELIKLALQQLGK
jgi:holliday junction DNA helicase RuvA